MLKTTAPMTNEQRSDTIRALLDERRGHVLYNRPDRVKDVDEELRRLGHDAAPAHERAERRPSNRARKAAETR
jgi:hypothetical protein